MEPWTPFAVLIAAPVVWFGAQAVLSLIMRPYRLKLRDGLAYLEAHAKLNDAEKQFVQHLWRNAYSARAAIFLCMTYLEGLLMTKDAVRREVDCLEETHPSFCRDRYMTDMLDWYFLSVFAANPLFGPISLVLRWLWHAKVELMLRTEGDAPQVRAMPPMEAAIKV